MYLYKLIYIYVHISTYISIYFNTYNCMWIWIYVTMYVNKFVFLLLMLYFSFLSCKAFKCNIIQSVSVQCSFSSFTPNENNKKEENKNKIKEIYWLLFKCYCCLLLLILLLCIVTHFTLDLRLKLPDFSFFVAKIAIWEISNNLFINFLKLVY